MRRFADLYPAVPSRQPAHPSARSLNLQCDMTPDPRSTGVARRLPRARCATAAPCHRAAPPPAHAVDPDRVASVLVHPGRLDARCPGGAAATDPPEPTGRRGVRRQARALSAQQEAIIAAIRSWLTEHGEGPTVRELGTWVGLSRTSSVAHHLAQLEKRGLISRTGPDWSTCYLVTPEPPRRGLRSR